MTADKDLVADVLDTLQDVSRQLGSLTERVTRIERDIGQVVATLHTGNGREAVTTRLAQVETKAKETRGRVIKLEEDSKKPENTGQFPAVKQGFWVEYGKSVVPGIVAVLMALAALLTALATRYDG